MKENENNKQIKEFSSLIEVNVKRLFRNEPLDFKLQVPDVSNESFIEYLTLAYETFWYRLYLVLAKHFPGKESPEKDFFEIINKISLPKIKEQVYTYLGLPVFDEKPIRTIQKLQIQKSADINFTQTVLSIQKTHKDLLHALIQANRSVPFTVDPIEHHKQKKAADKL